MAIEHIKEQGIDVEFDLQIVFTPHFCSVIHGLNQEELAKMGNAQQRWSHARKAKGDKMKNLITYLMNMNVEDKMNTRLDMLPQDGSPSHTHMINYFIKYRKNGIGAMSAEERMAASKKGVMAASEKRSSNDKMGIAWEKKYDEFKTCVEMSERGTPLYTWQQTQLSNTHVSCLNAKIWKEIEENKGSTEWSEWRVNLSDCVEQNIRAKIDNSWEKKYDEFKRCVGMPESGTQLYNW